MTGTIRDWDSQRHYGFIEWLDRRGKTRSVFCHGSAIAEFGCHDLAPGTAVSFEFETNARGRHACRVQRLEQPAEAVE